MQLFKVKNLFYQYGQNCVLKKLNLQIGSNEVTAIIGPNGAGKTTLIKILGRILTDFQGMVYFNNRSILDCRAKEFATRVGIMFSNLNFTYNYQVREFLFMARYPYVSSLLGYTREDHEKVEQAVMLAGISKLLDKGVQELSSGELQLVLITHLLAQDTEVMLFDEPFAHLDIKHQFLVMDLLKRIFQEKQKTIVVVTHNIYHMERFVNKVVLLKNRNVFTHGSVKKIMIKSNIRKLYDIPEL